MKIVHTTPRYVPNIGGVETCVAQIASRMAAQGHTVEVLTQSNDPSLPPCEIVDGVLVRRFPMALAHQHYAFAPGLWSYLARHNRDYDVIHAHSYHALPALGAALTAHRPLVFTPYYHGTGHSWFRSLLHKPYRPLGATIFARARHIICISEAESVLVRQHFPHSARRVTVIPCGVDVKPLRAAEPFADDRVVLLCAGRLEGYKNVQRVIEALTHLDDRFVLYVTGDGPARPALQERTAQLGLRDRVAFLGRVETPVLHRWLRTATVYVSMSSHEAFGISLLEALVAGAGVVAADIPAYREIVPPACAAMVSLVALDVPSQTLARTIQDAAAARGAQTQAPTLDVASWDDVADRVLHLYGTAVHAVRAA